MKELYEGARTFSSDIMLTGNSNFNETMNSLTADGLIYKDGKQQYYPCRQKKEPHGGGFDETINNLIAIAQALATSSAGDVMAILV